MKLRQQLSVLLVVLAQVFLFILGPLAAAQTRVDRVSASCSGIAPGNKVAGFESNHVYCPTPENGPVPDALEARRTSSSKLGGLHCVILSWNASVPTANHAAALGYCLYRSEKTGGSRENPTFGEPQRLNEVSRPDTSCVDRSVENGVTYRYVVTAVNRNQSPSSPSDPAFAEIPSDQQPSSGSPNTQVISCGGPS